MSFSVVSCSNVPTDVSPTRSRRPTYRPRPLSRPLCRHGRLIAHRFQFPGEAEELWSSAHVMHQLPFIDLAAREGPRSCPWRRITKRSPTGNACCTL